MDPKKESHDHRFSRAMQTGVCLAAMRWPRPYRPSETIACAVPDLHEHAKDT